MTYLVTGGAGFIGSHLVDRLLLRGDRVRVLDDFSSGRPQNLPAPGSVRGLELAEGSILEPDCVADLARGTRGIFHLAAAVGVKKILEDPVGSLETNVAGTRNVLCAAQRLRVPVLYASSSEVYGKSTELPFREDAPLLFGATSEPRWSYACAKALGEWSALAHARADGLEVRVARLFNTVGPRQVGRYGMVLPRFVRQALAGEPVTVYGDGSQSRAFVHVRDTVEALLGLAETPAARGEVFNVGGTREITIESLARLVIERSGSSSSVVHMPYREAYGMEASDLPRRVPCVEKLARITGFRASVPLEVIVDDVIAEQRTAPRAAGYPRPGIVR